MPLPDLSFGMGNQAVFVTLSSWAIACLLATLSVVIWACVLRISRRWCWRRQIGAEVERSGQVTMLVRDMDDEPYADAFQEGGDPGEVEKSKGDSTPSARRPSGSVSSVDFERKVGEFTYRRWAHRLGQEAKVKFGYKLEPTTANRLMVHHYLAKELRAKNTRTLHLSKVLPRAVNLAFIPTKDEILADQELQSSSYRKMYTDGNAKWTGVTWREWAISVLGGPPPDAGLKFRK